MHNTSTVWTLRVFVFASLLIAGAALIATVASGANDFPVVTDSDCATVGPVQTGTNAGSVASGGNEYDLQWFVPSSYEGSEVPMLINFHGLSIDGPTQAAFSEVIPVAEREGFVAVHPTGLAVSATDTRPSWEVFGLSLIHI